MAARSIFLLLLTSQLTGSGADARGIDCGNIQFKANTIDSFSYHGVVQNGINGTTDKVTRLKISTDLEISNSQNCEFLLKLSNVQFYESLGKDKNYQKLPKNDFVNRLEKYPLKFEMKNGVVKEIKPSVKSVQSDVLNLQRGILSTLQVRDLKEGLLVEDDVSGSCETVYVNMKKDDQTYLVIEKVKDLNTCISHHNIRSTIDGNSFNEDNTDEKKDSVYDSQSKCVYKLNKDGSGLVKAHCKEKFLARAFSSNGNSGAYVVTSAKLKRISSKSLSNLESPYKDYYSTSIKFDHELPVDKNTNSIEYQKKAKALLMDLAKTEFYESKYNSAERFFELVILFRHLKSNDVQAVVKSVDIKSEQTRSFLFDAMAQCGTAACLEVLFRTVEQYGMQKEGMKFLPYLAFIKDPTPEVVGLLLGLHQKTQHPTLILLITTLSYRMCNNHKEACSSGRISQTMQDTENYLLSMLGNDCQTDDPRKQSKILFALKGIGNLGRLAKAMPLIMDCVTNAKHSNMSTAALQSIRKMKLSKETRYTLLEILADQNNELEKRMEVFMLLMLNPTRQEIIFAKDIANDPQDVTQLRSFVNSYLRSAIKNKAPASKGISKLIKEVLHEYPLNDFNPSASRYSKAFLHSANFMQFAGTASGMTFFHPDSFVPRVVNLNLTTHLFGFSINALEVNARMEGLERLVGKYLGNEGYLSSSYMKKIFKIPNRQKRSLSEDDEYEDIDRKVNMKASSPQASVSFKMFGNEIQVLTLSDLPFLNGELDDMNIIHELYQLTKGKRKVLKHNMIVMEVSHTVPTILGMPMKIALNGSAVVTVDVNGKVDMKNLIFGPKTVTIHGNIKPSVSLHASGKLSVQCYSVSEIGTSFLGNVHFGKDFRGKIHYEEGKEVISELEADKKMTDLFNISYNIFHETGYKKEEVKGVEKRAKGLLCTKDLFDTSITGSDICFQASFPNAFYNISAPYFPLTGPFNLGVRHFPQDPLLKKYVLHVRKVDDMFTISIGTPGASSERKYSLNIGLARKDEGGMVGFTVGEMKRGVVVDYVFHGDTNELQATLTSNFTKAPIVLDGEFINQTDPTTLNRHVGIRWSFSYDKIFVENDLFYKNTYEYWELGSKIEYAKGRAAKLGLKIQYEPQQFDLVIEHKPTNTKILAKAVPSLPLISGQLNITHGNELKVDSSGMIDISKYEIKGDLKVKPQNFELNAKGKIEPKNKRLWFNGNVNGKPISIDSKITDDGKIKTLTNNFVYYKSKPIHVLTWDSESWNTTLDVGDEFNMYWKNTIRNTAEDTLRMLSTISVKKGEEIGIENTIKYSSDLHEFCSRVSVPNGHGSGNCYTFYHNKEKQGMVIKVLQAANWNTLISMLRTSSSNGANVDFAIMHYVKMMYERNADHIAMKFNVPWFTATIEKLNKDTFDARIDVHNGSATSTGKVHYTRTSTGRSSMFSIVSEAIHKNFVVGRLTLNSTSQSKSHLLFDSPFVNVLSADVKNKHMYTVVIKDTASAPPAMLGNKDYLTIDMNGWKIAAVEINVKHKYRFRVVEERTAQAIAYTLKFGQFNPWKNRLLPTENIVSVVAKSNGKMELNMFDTNAMRQYQSMGQSMIMQYIGQYSNKVFGEILGMDGDLTGKLSRVMQTAMISYFSTIKCNGKEVHEKFIKNEIEKEDVVKVMLAILKFPMSKQFQKLNKLDKGKETKTAGKLVSAFKKNQQKNILDMVGGIVEDLRNSDEKVDFEMLNKLKKVFENDKSFDIFEKEFFFFIQQMVNEITKLVKDQKEMNLNKLDLSFITKYLPAKYGSKFESTIKNILNALKSWTFDVSITPQENLKALMKLLEDAKAFDLLEIDYIDVILKSIVDRSNFPKDVGDMLKKFLKNMDHVTLVQKVTKFTLQTFGVKAPHKSYVDRLMNSKNIDEYFTTLAKVILSNGKLTEEQKKSFQQFLDTSNRAILFQQIKDILKGKYGVSDFGIKLLENLFANGNLDSFKNLPTIYSVNFFPKLTLKILVNLKNLRLSELLQQFTVFIKDEDVKEALIGVIKNKQNLDEIPTNLLKLIIKKSEGLDMKEEEKKMLNEVNQISMKFLAVALGKEKNQGKIIKSLVLQYYGSIYNILEKVLPDPLKPIMAKLNAELSKVLQSIREKDLELDATKTIFKTGKKISETVIKFVDENFESFLKKDLLSAVKAVMMRIKFGKVDMWQWQETYMKRINEQFAFMIRLLGQFSSTEKNYFAEEFTKDGKILYYKIYQSVWKNQVSNPKNLKQLAALFQGLEKEALNKIVEVTGGYSMKATVDKIVLFVKGLVEGESFMSVVSNLKDDNTPFKNVGTVVTEQFNKKQSLASVVNTIFKMTKGFAAGKSWLDVLTSINKEEETKISYDTLLVQLKELLVLLGHVKQDETTINQIVRNLMPEMAKEMTDFYQNAIRANTHQIKTVKKWKMEVEKAFNELEKEIDRVINKENSFVRMLLDLLAPSVTGLQPVIARALNYNKTFDMETINELRLLCKGEDFYIHCELFNLYDNIRIAKHDETLLDTVLASVEKVALKYLDENIKNDNRNLKRMKDIVVGMTNLSKKKLENPLQEFVFGMADLTQNIIKQDSEFQKIVKSLTSHPDFNKNQLSLRTMINKYIAEPLNNITWIMPDHKIQKEARKYVPNIVKTIAKTLHNVSRNILFGVDKIKTPLAKSAFVKDPVGFVLSLPKTILADINKNMGKYEVKTLQSLSKFERDVKNLHSKILKEIGQYSGKLNEVSEKLLNTYKAEISKYLDPVIKNLEETNQKIENELKGYMITTGGNEKLKQKLSILTKKSKGLRGKYQKIQKQYISNLKKQIKDVLNKKDLMGSFDKEKIMKTLFGEVDRKLLAKVLQSLNQDLRGILSNTIYPELETLAKSIDETVCSIKKNISKNYVKNDKGQVLFWEMPGAYQQFQIMEKDADNVMVQVEKIYKVNIEKLSAVEFNAIKNKLMYVFDEAPEKGFSYVKKGLTKYVAMVNKGRQMYQNYAGASPDKMFRVALKKYQHDIKRLATIANKVLQFTPPSDLETPVLKFLGFKNEQERNLFEPISRTAYLFEKSLVTFDGKAIYLPKDLHGVYKDCKYLLTRDFQWKNFTAYLHGGKFVVEMKDGKVVIDRLKNNQVEVFMRVPHSKNQRLTDFPVQMAFSSVTKPQSNILKIESLAGLSVYCTLDSFMCNLTVSGYYHNKTLGLFGTNNVENSDDLRMPSGEIAYDLVEFVNAYELLQKKECFIEDPTEILDESYNEEVNNFKSECKMFENQNQPKDLIDFELRATAFKHVCQNEKNFVNIQAAFGSSIKKEFGQKSQLLQDKTPDMDCSSQKKTMRYFSDRKNKVLHFTILMKLVPNLEKARRRLKLVLKKVQQDVGNYVSIKYCVVGYGGQGVMFYPHVQTGNGQVFTDLDGTLKALELFKFTGKPTSERLGLSALKFASQLDFKAGTKIFFLFDDDVTYTYALREMIDVSGQLSSRGIVLNTVNAYKMRRDVIGKDSYGMRYHVREPLGQHFSDLSFPPSDDYIPLVKQSRGAVFTLKAFIKTSEKWSKALPLSISRAISMQTKTDQKQCKECSCGRCKAVLNDICNIAGF